MTHFPLSPKSAPDPAMSSGSLISSSSVLYAPATSGPDGILDRVLAERRVPGVAAAPAPTVLVRPNKRPAFAGTPASVYRPDVVWSDMPSSLAALLDTAPV